MGSCDKTPLNYEIVHQGYCPTDYGQALSVSTDISDMGLILVSIKFASFTDSSHPILIIQNKNVWSAQVSLKYFGLQINHHSVALRYNHKSALK